MKTKLFTVFLAFAVSVGIVRAWDYNHVQIDELYYNLDEHTMTAEVTYQEYESDDNYAYKTTIVIPSSVTYDDNTFSVTSIGEYAFFNFNGRLTSVTIPNSVISIGEYAFTGAKLISADIPNSVTNIGRDAFANNIALTSVSIGNGVARIGEGAFYDCPILTSVTIPNSVTSIEYYAFAGCPKLTNISVSADNPTYDSRDNCNAIVETASNTLILGCQNTVIPNNVTSIGEAAFVGSPLTSINIPNSVTSIGEQAFGGCRDLTSIDIPNSVTSIESQAFYSCSGLTSVTIPNSVTSIGHYAFCGCSGLTSVTIPNSVISIGKDAFKDCSGLPVNDNIRYADTYLVEVVDKSLSSYSIKDGTRFIGNDAFSNCNNFTSIEIPSSVMRIESSAFDACTGLVSVTIPNSVINIEDDTFRECSSLSSITIPNSVTGIGWYAFWGCSSLISMKIPNNVTVIRGQAFYGCRSLMDIWVRWTTSEALAALNYSIGIFDDVPTSAKLHIPAEAWGCYSAYPWSSFTNRVATCNDDVDNTSFFSAQNGNTIDFELGRTIYKDGYYNTICLPFNIDDFTGTPLEGATVKEFVNAEVVDGCLELNVTDAASIEAGKPYLVSFESGEDITDAVFEEVTIATSTAQTIDGGAVDFVGILAPTDLELNNTNMLFLGANNELYWPNTNDPLRGYRAYFAVNSGSSAPVRYGMPARIVEQQNTATAIADNAAAAMPEKKLVNGEIVISRGSSSYNVLGMNIR